MPPGMPDIAVLLGLGAGSTIPSQYLVLDDPTRGILGTAQVAPANLAVDASPWLNSFTTFRGCSSVTSPLVTYEAGTATVTLINQRGEWDPDNYLNGNTAPDPSGAWSLTTFATPVNGTYFIATTAASQQVTVGDWVAFSAQPGVYIVTAASIPSGGFVNVSITPAAPGPVGAGTATQYATLLTPGVTLDIVAYWRNVAYPLWSGTVTNWDPQYLGPEKSYCVITATDGLGYLAQEGLRTELGSPAGAAELAGARVHRILDSAGWPGGTGFRDIDTGISLLQGTTLGGTPLAELQLVADSELGAFYMSPAGKATFRDRHALSSDPVSVTPNALFGSGTGELPYTTRDLEHQSTRMVNTVTASIAGGNPAVYTAALPVVRYGPRTFNRQDLLLMTDGEAQQWANLILYQNSDPEQWYKTLLVDPRANPAALFPQVLGRDVGHRITIRRRPPGMPSVTRDSFIRGVAHSYSRAFFQTTWTLQSASKYGFLILDDVTQGRLDHGPLAF
jgi:hypothetical protein